MTKSQASGNEAQKEGKKRLRGSERRSLFLDAAAEIVIESGVSAVTMEGVAARCSVNKSLPYRYFADKDVMLTALFDREQERYALKWAREVPKNANFEVVVRAALRHWCIRADEGGELLLRLVSDNGRMRVQARDMQRRHAEGWAAGLTQTYKIPPDAALQYAWFMVTGVTGVLAARDGNDDALIETIATAVIAGAEALQLKHADRRRTKKISN